jgi:hypothetical protein
MASLIPSGSASGTGSMTLAAPVTNSNQTVTIPDATGNVVLDSATQTLTNKTLSSPTITGAIVSSMGSSVITSGTAVASTSGTSIDFTGIPTWVKRITVMMDGVSTSGSSPVQIQLGDSGGAETSGYTGSVSTITNSVATFAFSAGFLISSSGGEAASTLRYGSLIISKLSNNLYTGIGNFSYGSSDTRFFVLAGTKSLSDVLDRVRITTVNGTDTFDAGSINILYE